jgi:hypothetical protein
MNVSGFGPVNEQGEKAHNSGEYLPESIGRTRRLRFSSIQTIFELEKRLANGIRERYPC